MFELDEVKKQNKKQYDKLIELGTTINIDAKKERLKSLEEQVKSPEFWSDNNKDNTKDILSELNEIKKEISTYSNLLETITMCKEMIELEELESSEDNQSYINSMIKEAESMLDELELTTLLSGKYDKNSAIITIHSGAGGTEAMDWVAMLYRMYTRWANDNDFSVEELDILYGDEAGIKSVTFSVNGNYAYGYLKSEHGIHRLVRISPFDAGGRRHTSFASVEVLPEIEDISNIDINKDDIKMDVFRASGAGGQHINKTSSAVRLTHIPTQTVVSCQAGRSQFQNRETAMKMLISKLYAIKEKEHIEKINDLKGKQMDIAWGSQIRSYVFCPYTLVKDHRTNFEVGDVTSVMDGNLNGFIFAFLKYEVNNDND